MSKNILVAVYGTLRKGCGNDHCMVRADGELVGKGQTVNHYNIYDLGAFPSVSLAHSGNETSVVVEVYAVDEDGLTGPLDCLEGYPHFYNRTKVYVELEDGEEVQAWIYHIDNEQGRLIESGDWCKR